MLAAIDHIVLQVGASDANGWQIIGDDGEPVSLGGYSGAKMQIRPTEESSVLLADWTTGNGKLALDLENNSLWRNLSPEDTQGITLTSLPKGSIGDYTGRLAVYQVELYTDSGQVDRFIQGQVLFTPEVIRG